MVPKLRLGELLIKEGLLTDEQLQQALTRQKQTGRRLGAVLQDLAFVTDIAIARLLAAQLKFPFFEPLLENVDTAIAKRLSELQVRKLRALPVGLNGDNIRVAVVDPTDWQAVDELPKLLRGAIDIEVIAESGLHALIDRIYSNTDNMQGLAKQLSDELKSVEGDAVDFTALGISAGAEDAPVVKLLQGLFDEAVRLRASDIHIEPMAKAVGIRLRVDGHLRAHAEFDSRLAPALASRLKLVAALDISERRLPQDGRFVVQVRKQTVDIRLSTLPGTYGESLVMRLLLKDPMLASLDKLGIPAGGLLAMQNALSQGAGLVLVTGPTGSGKTTTLYSTLKSLATEAVNVCTIEDPIEMIEPAFNQTQVQAALDMGFAEGLRALMRQDPDIIMVGEIRDLATAEMAIQAALTGHLVFSTLHTNDAASAITRLRDLGVPGYLISATVIGVLAQRLVRTLCPACKARDEATTREALDDLARPWRLGGGVRPNKPVGCPACRQTGYRGRVGLYELLVLGDQARTAVHPDHDMAALRRQAVKDGMRPLRLAGMMKVAEGQTTVDEVLRGTPAWSED